MRCSGIKTRAPDTEADEHEAAGPYYWYLSLGTRRPRCPVDDAQINLEIANGAVSEKPYARSADNRS